jgi:anti-anti-sigma factor
MTDDEPRPRAAARDAVDAPAAVHQGTDVSWSGAGTALCRIVGDLDMGTVHAAHAALERAIEAGPPVLVVDLSGVAFCDSAGLNLLLQVRLEAEAAGVALRLAGLPAAVARVFELTGAYTVFSVYASAEEAEHV